MKANVFRHRQATRGLILTLILAAALLLGPRVQAAETLPANLAAPSNLVVYEQGSGNKTMMLKYVADPEFVKFYENTRSIWAGPNGPDDISSDRYYWNAYGRGIYYSDFNIQVDYRLDSGAWQYNSSWDTDIWPDNMGNGYSNGFDGEYGQNGSQTSYCRLFRGGYVNRAGTIDAQVRDAYLEKSDGADTYYQFGTDNHTLEFRCRYIVEIKKGGYYDGYETNETTEYIRSDWSETASYGKNGSQPNYTRPSNLEAPSIRDLKVIPRGGYSGAPAIEFYTETPSSVLIASNIPASIGSASTRLEVEASLDGNSWVDMTTESIDRRLNRYDVWELWNALNPDQPNGTVFDWDGSTVYLRTRYDYSAWINYNDYEVKSPYSNTVNITVPEVEKYAVNITYETLENASYDDPRKSFNITEGNSLGYFNCDPIEGCHVEKVTVNGSVMYDIADAATHDLLNWYRYSGYEEFSFKSPDDTASKNLNIQITYGGTPTAQYPITVTSGEGGSIYPAGDSNNVVQVYHGNDKRFSISPYGGHEIDQVKIDGTVNEQAKTDGEYTFENVIGPHSIDATFNRVAWSVSCSGSRNGQVSVTSPENFNGWAPIGSSVTVYFKADSSETDPTQNYAIERITVDNVDIPVGDVSNDGIEGSYTIDNISGNHSIHVTFSETPVVRHTITATSSEGGTISPEGAVHVEEGASRQFSFYPSEGYMVDTVTVDGQPVSNLIGDYYIFQNVMSEHSIHVSFKVRPVPYHITVNKHGGDLNTVNPSGRIEVMGGSSQTFEFIAHTGYELEKVLVDGQPVTIQNNRYEFQNVAANHTLDVYFKVISHKVRFVDWDGTVLKEETVEHGQKAMPPADPVREGHVFTGWDGSYNEVSTETIVTAQYKPNQYRVIFKGWDGATLKTETVDYGAAATAPEPTARAGYTFSHWSADFSDVRQDITVIAVYTINQYTVTFVDHDRTVLKTETVAHGQAATPPADPTREGFTFIGWDKSAAYGHVTRDMEVMAEYVEGEAVVHTVTATAHGGYGTLSPIGGITVQEGSGLTVHIYPGEFGKLDRLEVDGEVVDAVDSYTFEAIAEDHTIDAYFVPTATISLPENPEGGSVTGSYGPGGVYIIVVNPDPGYELEQLLVNGEDVTSRVIDGTYTIDPADGDAEVVARFRPIAAPPVDNPPVNNPPVDDPPADSAQQPGTVVLPNTAQTMAETQVTTAYVSKTASVNPATGLNTAAQATLHSKAQGYPLMKYLIGALCLLTGLAVIFLAIRDQ